MFCWSSSTNSCCRSFNLRFHCFVCNYSLVICLGYVAKFDTLKSGDRCVVRVIVLIRPRWWCPHFRYLAGWFIVLQCPKKSHCFKHLVLHAKKILMESIVYIVSVFRLLCYIWSFLRQHCIHHCEIDLMLISGNVFVCVCGWLKQSLNIEKCACFNHYFFYFQYWIWIFLMGKKSRNVNWEFWTEHNNIQKRLLGEY